MRVPIVQRPPEPTGVIKLLRRGLNSELVVKMAPANIIDKVATLHPNLEIPTARHALFGHSAEASESVNQLSIPAWPGNNPRTGEKIQKKITT